VTTAAILAVSLIFVLMWSTGHITTKLGLPYIEPFKFLTIRFFLSAILLCAIALAVRAPWPRDRRQVGHILVAGLLMHAAYLGGVFVSIHLGLAAGALAVITGIQPILTGVAVGPVFGERVPARQWVGLVLGFIGVGLIVWEKTKIEGTASQDRGDGKHSLYCRCAMPGCHHRRHAVPEAFLRRTRYSKPECAAAWRLGHRLRGGLVHL
jgi:drug/metabolite transporter (DMT)-like permease